MGFINDTHMSQFISPADFEMSAGTWTMLETSHVVGRARSAADAAFTALIPIKIPSNASVQKGSKLNSIDIWYSIGEAAADDFATVELEKMTLPADDTAVSGEAVDITLDAGHDSAAERKAADLDHCMTVNIDSPVFIDDGESLWLKLVVDCAAATVFTFFGARANFTLRI